MTHRSKPLFSANRRSAARTKLALAALSCCLASPVFAQGGETEVAKTSKGPAPAVQAPAPTVTQAPAIATPAPQPASPVGGAPANVPAGGSNWQANVSAQKPAAPIEKNDLQVVEKINAYFNNMTNLQGTFVQTDPDNKQKRGRFYFEKPGKVRFDYGAPSKLKIISNGEYLAIEDHDLKTSDRYPLEMTPFRLLLSEKVDLGAEARIIGLDQGADAVVITVEDKKGDSPGRIRLFFNKADMSLREWIISDAQGLDTRVEVSNLEQNKRVSDNLFEFSKDIGFKNVN